MGVGRFRHDVGRMGDVSMKDRLLLTGVIGTVLVAICCFTPILVILLGVVGLSAAVGYLDLVLLPALVAFLGITGYALWRRKKAK